MTKYKNSFIHLMALCAIALWLASCSASLPDVAVTSQDVAILQDTPQDRIPLRAGFYTGPLVKNIVYNTVAETRDWMATKFLPDAEITKMFREAASRIFENVVHLSGAETLESYRAKKLDVIVMVGRVTVEDNVAGSFRAFGDRLYKTRVLADWQVTSPDGKRVYFTNVMGEGEAQIVFGLNQEVKANQNKNALVASFDDHFRKAYQDIVGGGWWKDTSWRSE